MEVSNELMEKHDRLVWFVVKKIRGRLLCVSAGGHEEEDLAQIGRIGLYKALKNFDPKRGLKLSTYAIPMIQGEIFREIRDKLDYVRIPREAGKVYRDMKNKGINPREINADWVIKNYKCTEINAKIALEFFDVHFLSTEFIINNDGSPVKFENMLYDKDYNMTDNIIFREEYAKRLSILDEREKAVLEMTLAGKKQKEIAPIIGVNQVQVSRILKKAIKKIDETFNQVAV